MKKDDNLKLRWYEKKWVLVMFFLGWIVFSPSMLLEQNFMEFIMSTSMLLFLFFNHKQGLKRVYAKQALKETAEQEELSSIKQNESTYIFEEVPKTENNAKEPITIKSTPNISEVDFSYSKVRKLVPNFTVIDFETTGFSPSNDKIIQVAAIKYRNLEKVNEFSKFVDPLVPIPKKITQITGITNEDVNGSLKIEEVLPLLLKFVENDVLVAHNAPFDMKFLLAKMHEVGIDYRKFKVIDTLSLARKNIDFTKNHKLETMKSFLKLNQLPSHEALSDCYVTGELYKYCYHESSLPSPSTN
ncbi:exonuclease domain-containing protein [Priestia flexa]|uniref:3'-5' exonuclease n=1 Tax=Priestia flexa TaxID=86664 RepID=UPI001CFCE722|nr:exonuclease domain-containing protein [Priestia flexa]